MPGPIRPGHVRIRWCALGGGGPGGVGAASPSLPALISLAPRVAHRNHLPLWCRVLETTQRADDRGERGNPSQVLWPSAVFGTAGSGDRIFIRASVCTGRWWGQRRAPRWWASPCVENNLTGTSGSGATSGVRRGARNPSSLGVAGWPCSHAGRQGEVNSLAILVHATQHDGVVGRAIPSAPCPSSMRRQMGRAIRVVGLRR